MSAETHLLANLILIVFAVRFSCWSLVYYQHKKFTLAESIVYSLMAFLMVQSCLGQVLFLAGVPDLYPYLLFLCALLVNVGVQNVRRTLAMLGTAGLSFFRKYPVAISGLLCIWGYGVAISLWPVLRPLSWGWLYINPLWGLKGGIFSNFQIAANFALPVLNHIVFSAPWQPSLAPALANLSGYMVIGFATYALARRYAWPSLAITVTLLVVSMPRLIHQSTTIDSELLPASAALTVILALFRILESFEIHDGVMVVAAIGFSVSSGRLCYLLPTILSVLTLVLVGRRYGIIPVNALQVRRQIKAVLPGVLLAVVFLQLGPVSVNLAAGQPWIGSWPKGLVIFNDQALLGTPANLLRYFFLSLDLPVFIDHFSQWALDFSLLKSLKGLADWVLVGVLKGQGAADVFDWSWQGSHRFIWFGPAGFFFILPALVISFFKGPRRLKSTALSLTVYLLLISLIAAWRPENVRFMTPFFVCAGFLMAFALPPWRITRNGRWLLQVMGVLILAHTILG